MFKHYDFNMFILLMVSFSFGVKKAYVDILLTHSYMDHPKQTTNMGKKMGFGSI
jgi:hypothetical protein